MYKDYLSIIILFCIKSLNGERSLSAIYYLLKGKKTSQTIQDSKLYNLSFLFQLFPYLSKNSLEQKALDLLNQQLIEKHNDQYYLITEQGKEELEIQLKNRPFPKELDGWRYHSAVSIFWERISLLVQTMSNIIHTNYRFTPISKNETTLRWVKDFILSSKRNKKVLSEGIYRELLTLLSSISNKEATIFILRLSSNKRIGLTFEQISETIGDDIHRVHVLFTGILHDLIEKILSHQNEYPLLFPLLKDIYQPIPLTFSTKKTYQLLLLGKTVKEIAEIRHLKVSTIEDHIVELAHNLTNFNIEPFIDVEARRNIEDKIKTLNTNQLKEIKQSLNNVSYFQIRLVLAKEGD